MKLCGNLFCSKVVKRHIPNTAPAHGMGSEGTAGGRLRHVSGPRGGHCAVAKGRVERETQILAVTLDLRL